MENIDNFSGIYDFLSNFYKAEMIYNGKMYPTNEHFFQSHKAKFEADHEEIRRVPGPGSAKRLGRKVRMRED